MNEKEHLPMLGVGPFYMITIIAITVLCVVLSGCGIIIKIFPDMMRIPFLISGIICVMIGIILYIGAFFARIDLGIKENKLVINGVYAFVRHPIYSAGLFWCTGIILIERNLYLLILPILYWLFLTILMKKTEELWLRNLYGKEYEEYCRHVNRCIPWLSKKWMWYNILKF